MDYTKVSRRNCLLIILYFIFTFNSQFVETFKLEIKCLASRNEKWNKNKNICVTCKDCYPGSFRNLSEPYNGRTGDSGDEQCIPCSPCPDGTFSENGRGECSHCRTNCTDMNREYDSTCSKTQDAKCGSCLTNYEDTYGHFLFPCSPKKVHKELIPPKGEKLIRPDEETETAGDNPKDSIVAKSSPSPNFWIPVGITGIVVSFIVVVIFVGRKLKLATHNSDSSAEGAHDYTEINILQEGTIPKDNTALLDGDIETDAVREDTVSKVSTHIPRRNENVRTELENGQQPCARPELTQHIPSLSQLDGISVLQLSDGRIVSLQIVKDFCECKEQRSCECSSFYFPNLQLEKSDEYILTTASKICHDYSELFQKLGLTPPVLYQESDTRDRAPEIITQKELFIRLLNIWIEMKSKEATLKNLSIALCEAKFHKINKLLIDLYRNKIQSFRDTPFH